MTRVFVELPSFRNAWKSLGLTDGDLRRLQGELLADSQLGNVIQGTGGVRKMRFAHENRGKAAVYVLSTWTLRSMKSCTC